MITTVDVESGDAMTDLKIRKMRFGFADHPVPFCWNEANPAFSSMANAVSLLAVAFEKMITQAVPEAMPFIDDPEVAEEAEAFLRQEGQHSAAHRQHVKALIAAYPGLAETFDEIVGAFDELTATTPLRYRLAYTADLEATFTPVFKLMLDNEAELFASGDDRVASLFLWHFVEEVEHRASALIIYREVVGDPWYRMRVAPGVFKHVLDSIGIASAGFNRHVPLSERRVDSMSMFARHRMKRRLLRLAGRGTELGSMDRAFARLPWREQLTALAGVYRSQLPHHDPKHENLPALADEWFRRYDEGYDVTHWYTGATQGKRATGD